MGKAVPLKPRTPLIRNTLNLNISTSVNSTLRHINTRREALINNCIYERRGGGAQKKGVSLVSRAAGKGVFFFFARACWCVVLSKSSSNLERVGFE